jgi:hypothetical protein
VSNSAGQELLGTAHVTTSLARAVRANRPASNSASGPSPRRCLITPESTGTTMNVMSRPALLTRSRLPWVRQLVEGGVQGG